MIRLPGQILKTITDDGLELDGFLVEPKDKTDTLIIHFHGKEGDFLQNHFITTMAQTYPKHGYAFLTASHRGRSYIVDMLRKSATGYSSSQYGSTYDIFEDCVYDIDAWVKIGEQLGYDKIILQQHSTPHKIVWYVTQKKPDSVIGLIMICPADILYLFENYVEDYKKNLGLAKKLIDQGEKGAFMPVPLWSNCPVSAQTFYNWGNVKSNFFIFNFTHPEQGFGVFPKVTLPICSIFAENDFAFGTPAIDCIKMLQKNTSSNSFAGTVITSATHSFLGMEEKLIASILEILE